MTTQVDICNMALAKLGDEAVVSSVTPPYQSMQAQYCALFYPQALQVLLTKHDWAFATVTAALTSAASTNPLWLFQYALPADFLRMVGMRLQPVLPVAYGFPQQIVAALDQVIEFDVQAGVLFCNTDQAILVYLSNLLESESLFPALFVEALSWLLASMLAGPLLKGDNGAAAAQRLTLMFQQALKAAVEMDCLNTQQREHYVPKAVMGRW